jgi:hypothetical protein
MAFESVKITKEKPKVKPYTATGRPGYARPANSVWLPCLFGPCRPLARASALTWRAHRPERQRAVEEKATAKLTAGGSVGEAEATIMLPTRIRTSWCTMSFLGLAGRTRRRQWRVRRCWPVCASPLWPRWPDLRLEWASWGPRQLTMLLRRGRWRCQRGWPWWARAGQSFGEPPAAVASEM